LSYDLKRGERSAGSGGGRSAAEPAPGKRTLTEQLTVASAQPAVARTTGVQAKSNPAAPKKFATQAEVAAIQALIDQAKQAKQAAVKLAGEAETLQRTGDHKGAAAKEHEADAQRRAARGFKQQAITAAVAAYGIDISHVTSLLYSSTNPDGDAETDGRDITIGDAAFVDPGSLASTIAHEAEVHVNLQSMKGRDYDGPQGRRLNEVQAYDWEIAQANRFGLTKDEVAGLRRNRAHYMEGLSPDNQKRRLAGDYSLPKGHEDD
jgi:hypothetical protein